MDGKTFETGMTDLALKNKKQSQIIGLLPAAGLATRISPLPCSKELYPISFRNVDESHGLRPKVVGHYLLEKMQLANIEKVFIIIREGKWDIPAYFGDGREFGLHLAYLMMNEPYGVPFTLDQAYPFIRNAAVAFGFPDIIFKPDDAFSNLTAKLAGSGADIVLGLFQAPQPFRMDMVGLDSEGRVKEIQIKPASTNYRYTWIIAVWAPSFTQFMHEYVSFIQENSDTALRNREVFFSEVINAAMQNDMKVEQVTFTDGICLDIGIPENLVMAARLTPEAL